MAKQTVALHEPKPSKELLPTAAIPGSAEKIEVLRYRVEAGLPLHHEHDAGLGDYRLVSGLVTVNNSLD